MIWIMLIILLSIVVAALILKGVSKVRSKFWPDECDGSVLDMVMDFPKTCVLVLFLTILIGLYQVTYQMGQMYKCSVRSSVQKVETQYTWIFDSCQFKNKDGAWIDFKQVRGVPEGAEE